MIDADDGETECDDEALIGLVVATIIIRLLLVEGVVESDTLGSALRFTEGVVEGEVLRLALLELTEGEAEEEAGTNDGTLIVPELTVVNSPPSNI